MTALRELQDTARELAVVSHALGVKVQGHDLRLACVEAAAAALTLRAGSSAESIAAAASAVARCQREIEARIQAWAKVDPEGCRAAVLQAHARAREVKP